MSADPVEPEVMLAPCADGEYRAWIQMDPAALSAITNVEAAAGRMQAWAEDHPEVDTQGIMPDEWTDLARAAVSS